MARASGVTVRTLHYYDQIGLVSPGERTAAGHRHYGDADIRRLYRVRTLVGLGLPLAEIATVLGEATDDLTAMRDLLTAQRVRCLLDRLTEQAMPAPEQFLATLEPMPIDPRQYLSDPQLATLTDRATELGASAIEALKADWIELFGLLRRHFLAGTPVDDPAVRALEAATTALWQDNRDHLGHQLDRRIGWSESESGGSAEVIDYLRRARAVEEH